MTLPLFCLWLALAQTEAQEPPPHGLPFKLGVEKPKPEAIEAVRELAKSPPPFVPPPTEPLGLYLQGILIGLERCQDFQHRRLGKIPASGGEYFFQTVTFDVPHFFQHDARWAGDPLGPSNSTLGREGCAVACGAMLLNFYGADTDPQRLNRFLIHHDRGYTGNGWLWWEDAADMTGGAIVHAYESDPSYHLIDENLKRGNPVIVRVTFPNRVTHFVVIAGKSGFDYLVEDPGVGGQKGLYPLKEMGLPIDGLRFYVPTGKPVRQPPETLLPVVQEVPPEEADEAMPEKPLAPVAMPVEEAEANP